MSTNFEKWLERDRILYPSRTEEDLIIRFYHLLKTSLISEQESIISKSLNNIIDLGSLNSRLEIIISLSDLVKKIETTVSNNVEPRTPDEQLERIGDVLECTKKIIPDRLVSQIEQELIDNKAQIELLQKQKSNVQKVKQQLEDIDDAYLPYSPEYHQEGIYDARGPKTVYYPEAYKASTEIKIDESKNKTPLPDFQETEDFIHFRRVVKLRKYTQTITGKGVTKPTSSKKEKCLN